MSPCPNCRTLSALISRLRRVLRDYEPPVPGRTKGATDQRAAKRREKIRQLWASGEFKSQVSLARRLGVCPKTVWTALHKEP